MSPRGSLSGSRRSDPAGSTTLGAVQVPDAWRSIVLAVRWNADVRTDRLPFTLTE